MWRGTDRTRSQMILTEYRYDPKAKDSKSVYLVRHNSRIHQTVLEQHLTIERDSFGRFIPTIELKDFPEGLSDRESMLKLADWLHRLGVAIEDNWSQPMTKSTITREQLLEIIETDHVQCGEASYLARMALAAMDSEPVAEVVSIYGDPEAFGEREIRPLVGIQQMPYGTKLYRHVQQPVVESEPVALQPELAKVIYHFRDWNEGFPVERFKADYVISWMLANYPPAQPAKDREQVRREHAEWSQATFGNVGPVGPLKHLSKEALEAAEQPGDLSEWADMQFLLWDVQRRADITDDQITQAMIEKLVVNKQREWPDPKDGEPRLHINNSSEPTKR